MKKIIIIFILICFFVYLVPSSYGLSFSQVKTNALNIISKDANIVAKTFDLPLGSVSWTNLEVRDFLAKQLNDAFILSQSNGSISWAKTYGGKSDDYAYSIQKTLDSGYIVCGQTSSFGAGGWDILILKLDKNGNISWAKTYGGKSDDYASSIQKTLDSGYIVCGKTSSFGAGGDDIFVLKLNSNGNVLWAKTYGKVGDEAAYSIEQTADSGYIIAGQTSSFGAGGWDILILKLDQNGNISWAKTYGGKSDDYASSIQKTLDSGYIVSGVTSSYGAGGLDYLVLKLDSNGSVSWAKTYGGDNIDWSYSLQRVVDGGYIVIGKSSFNCVCGKDILALKIDFNGNILWAKTFGSEYDESANSIQQTTDSGYIIAGQTSSFGAGGDDVLILKLDSSGNISWAKTFGSEGNESLNSIQQTTDSGYIACGQTSSFGVGGWDILLLKLDQNGNISCSNSNYLKDAKSKLDTESVSPFTSNVNINAIPQGVKVSSINITTSSTNLNSKIVCGSIIIVLKIGDLNFTVNGVKNTLDSPPVIKNGRTLLPIRAIIESLGGSVGWDATERKVAVSLGSKTIELWIGKSTAKVNGVNKPIDKDNSKVVPEIINGRTMLPLRFVAESLGCDVQWDANTKTITIKYIN